MCQQVTVSETVLLCIPTADDEWRHDTDQGQSKAVFTSWLAGQSKEYRDGIEVVAMDGFTGFKTAVSEELRAAVEPLRDSALGFRYLSAASFGV